MKNFTGYENERPLITLFTTETLQICLGKGGKNIET
jgi:hypothetical protein